MPTLLNRTTGAATPGLPARLSSRLVPADSLHEYRVLLGDDSHGVYATADRSEQTTTVDIPTVDGTTVRAVIGVVAARALYMAVSEAVYSSLEPVGPWLRIERADGAGWVRIGPGR